MIAAAIAMISAIYLGWLIAGEGGAAIAPATFLATLALRRAGPRWPLVARLWGGGRSDGIKGLIGDITQDVGIGFATMDTGGRIAFANRCFVRLVAAEQPVEGVTLADLFGSQHRATILSAQAALVTGTTHVKDLRVELKSAGGEPVMIMLGYSARFRQLFCSLKDDSLQLRMEAQVRQASKMQAVGQLAGGLAHDFNNILTAIIGHCDLMLMRHGPGDMDYHDTDQIRQNANRAADLVRQLLAFSRQQTLRARVVPIGTIVGDLGHLLRRLLGERVRLTVTNAANLAPVRVDPGQIEQVLINLAVNACDAMADGGSLTIATYPVAARAVAALGHKMMPAIDYVAIAVTDTGVGISKDVIANIFDPFFTTKDVGQGTGLGLSMAYGIVKQSGGFIFADSAEGYGTCFSIYLPAVHGEAVEADRAAAGAGGLGPGDDPARGGRGDGAHRCRARARP